MPRGTSPTVATPCAARSNQDDSTMPSTSTTRPHGTRGANRAPRNSTASEPAPIAAVSGVMSPRCVSTDQARLSTSPDSGGMPSRLGISPMMMSSTRPNTNPVTIGLDRNSAAQPMRSRPPMTSARPAAIASAEVRPTARSGSPCARPATSEPESTDTVETGPTTRCGEEPSTAYASSANGIA